MDLLKQIENNRKAIDCLASVAASTFEDLDEMRASLDSVVELANSIHTAVNANAERIERNAQRLQRIEDMLSYLDTLQKKVLVDIVDACIDESS